MPDSNMPVISWKEGSVPQSMQAWATLLQAQEEIISEYAERTLVDKALLVWMFDENDSSHQYLFQLREAGHTHTRHGSNTGHHLKEVFVRHSA